MLIDSVQFIRAIIHTKRLLLLLLLLLWLFANSDLLPRLVNLAVSPGVKYRQSSMPFVQMENISNFLRACQVAPLSLAPYDVFLTVDLYERKDPLQVLQCISAFSRSAHLLQPTRFPRTLGAKVSTKSVASHSTGSSQGGDRASNTPVSSWTKPSDEERTMPAWNIHQYGYMGGATQGNQRVAFGVPRQITSADPHVPSVAEKEKRLRAEAGRQRSEAEEVDRMRQEERQKEREAEEERAKAEEDRLWNEQTERLREQERRQMAEESQRWAEEQRKWEEEEERQLAEEIDAEKRLEHERHQRLNAHDARLNGQFLSQYRSEQATAPAPPAAVDPIESSEKKRIKELEKELEQAKERERQYEAQRHEQAAKKDDNSIDRRNRSKSPAGPRPLPPKPSYDLSTREQERHLLRMEWQKNNQDNVTEHPPAPPSGATTSRPLPDVPVEASSRPAPPPRPLPDPDQLASANRVDRFLSSHPAPAPKTPTTYRPKDYSTTAEVDAENERRIASQQKTRAGGWASKSLLEREMEAERERQREWEENQKEVKAAAARGRKDSVGTGPGEGAWDVNQYGYLGGDNQNRGGLGIGFGAKRQIVAPKPKGL